MQENFCCGCWLLLPDWARLWYKVVGVVHWCLHAVVGGLVAQHGQYVTTHIKCFACKMVHIATHTHFMLYKQSTKTP